MKSRKCRGSETSVRWLRSKTSTLLNEPTEGYLRLVLIKWQLLNTSAWTFSGSRTSFFSFSTFNSSLWKVTFVDLGSSPRDLFEISKAYSLKLMWIMPDGSNRTNVKIAVDLNHWYGEELAIILLLKIQMSCQIRKFLGYSGMKK